jgi:hypothetical protein
MLRIRIGSASRAFSKGDRHIMATSNVPARVPERQPEQTSSRPAGWREEKKPARFVIKIGGMIPS